MANERVQTNAAGQVVLKLKTPWRDGTTHLVMSPLEFMQRLAALVPRPRLHLIRFHGVLAPNAKLRAMVVPQEPEPEAQAAPAAECEAICVHHRPVRLGWAKLLKRVFDLDLEHCPNCGGELKIIAAILEQPVIEKILTHLGLQARAPPRSPARGQALQAEPGHKQSSGLFVPGEESGHWPGAPCKGLDDPDPSLFMRPGTQGCGDRLRPGFSRPRNDGRVIRVNPRPGSLVGAFVRGHRHSAGRHQPQRPHSEPRPMVLATRRGPSATKKCV